MAVDLAGPYFDHAYSMGQNMTPRVGKEREVEKVGMVVWQTAHSQCRSRTATSASYVGLLQVLVF